MIYAYIDIHYRDDFRIAPSQWETSLQSNGVSHWLGANLKSALYIIKNPWNKDIIEDAYTAVFDHICVLVWLEPWWWPTFILQHGITITTHAVAQHLHIGMTTLRKLAKCCCCSIFTLEYSFIGEWDNSFHLGCGRSIPVNHVGGEMIPDSVDLIWNHFILHSS